MSWQGGPYSFGTLSGLPRSAAEEKAREEGSQLPGQVHRLVEPEHHYQRPAGDHNGGIAGTSRLLMRRGSELEREQAVMKLYVMLLQNSGWSNIGKGEVGGDGLSSILEVDLPGLLKEIANIVLRKDKHHSEHMRQSAAASLKLICRWIESQLGADDKSEVVQQLKSMLQEVLLDGGHTKRTPENFQEEEVHATSQDFNLLDTSALEGLLDHTTASPPFARRNQILDTRQIFDSMVEVGTLEALVSQRARPTRSNKHLMGTHLYSSMGSVLDTADIAGHMLRLRGAARAIIWLFKSDQQDAWCAAASLVGSMALQGTAYIQALGGTKLIKPLMWVLRYAHPETKAAAMRALHYLSKDATCCTFLSRHDRYLRMVAKIAKEQEGACKYLAAATINAVLAHDPSTHWILGQTGIVVSLVKILREPTAPSSVKAEATLGLKHLTTFSQRNRDDVMQAKGMQDLIQMLKVGNTNAQYNAARVLRHLAMSGGVSAKSSALPAVPALLLGLKNGRPRVQFACAATLAMVTEGQPQICQAIEEADGVRSLVALLSSGGNQGKKAAAEALQALAAESEDIRPKIAAAGAIWPLTQMLETGSLQQQAAAAGAVQALAYCPNAAVSLSSALAGHGVIEPLVRMLKHAPGAMRCAAAGALCNLALRSSPIQMAIISFGALEPLVQLLVDAQPDGQYSAAALLNNLAAAGPDTSSAILQHNPLPAIAAMLKANSWYCRIVAADLLAHLFSNQPAGKTTGVLSGTYESLLALLCLQEMRSEEVPEDNCVAHVAYERSHDVIVMKGYPFLRAKMVAANALGVMLAHDLGAPPIASGDLELLGTQLQAMLSMGSNSVRLVAIAAIIDIARTSAAAKEILAQENLIALLFVLLKQASNAAAKVYRGSGKQDSAAVRDASAIAAALAVLICESSRKTVKTAVLDPNGLTRNLLYLIRHAPADQCTDFVNLLFILQEVSSKSKKVIDDSGISERIACTKEKSCEQIHSGCHSAALLRGRMKQQSSGYAITAKPSANLYILLQVPLEELMPSTLGHIIDVDGLPSRTQAGSVMENQASVKDGFDVVGKIPETRHSFPDMMETWQ